MLESMYGMNGDQKGEQKKNAKGILRLELIIHFSYFGTSCITWQRS